MQEAGIVEITRYVSTLINTSDYLKEVLGKNDLEIRVDVVPRSTPYKQAQVPQTIGDIRAREICRIMATKWELDVGTARKHLEELEGRKLQITQIVRAMEGATELDDSLVLIRGPARKKILVHKTPEKTWSRFTSQVGTARQKCEQI